MFKGAADLQHEPQGNLVLAQSIKTYFHILIQQRSSKNIYFVLLKESQRNIRRSWEIVTCCIINPIF